MPPGNTAGPPTAKGNFDFGCFFQLTVEIGGNADANASFHGQLEKSGNFEM
jgi:hypothetical protein